MKKQWILLPIAATTCVTPLFVSCNKHKQADTFDKLLASYKQMLKDTVKTTDYENKTPDQIKQELDEQRYNNIFSEPCDTYFFKNIDYKNGDRAIWPAHLHIVRTLQIAMIADRDNNKELMEIAKKLTCYWLCNNFANSNWWFNEIGVPRDLSNLAIFLIKKLTSEQQDKLIEWIRHGSLKYAEATTKYTGTNMFWAGDITMKSACLVKDRDELNVMFDYVGEEIKQDAQEGFQSDGTYFQHRKLLYTGGYGRQGALLLAKIASAFKDSDLELAEDKLSIVVDFALDGMRYFTHKGNFNFQCMGRVFTRKQASDYGGGVTDLGNIEEMRYIADLPNCPRKEELKDLISKWEKRESTFEGIKYFPKSNFIACNFDGVYIGLRGNKEDLICSEMGNGENQLGHNLAYGFTTCVMETGQEYADISPVWDYSYIPGTTTIVEDDDTLNAYTTEDDAGITKTGTYYGGINAKDGIAFTSQATFHKFRDPENTSLYKYNMNYQIASFACNDGVAILGCNIAVNQGAELHTTVDQFVKQGEVKLLNNDASLQHNNVVYTNITSDDAKLKFKEGDVTQPWNRNNHSYQDLSDTIKKHVVGVTLDYGSENGQEPLQYGYTIQTKKQFDANKKFKIAKNDDEAQAVQLPNGKIACIFYQNNINFDFDGITCSGNKGEFKIFSK